MGNVTHRKWGDIERWLTERVLEPHTLELFLAPSFTSCVLLLCILSLRSGHGSTSHTRLLRGLSVCVRHLQHHTDGAHAFQIVSFILYDIVIIHMNHVYILIVPWKALRSQPETKLTTTASRGWTCFPFQITNWPLLSVCVSKVSDFTWSHDGTQALISYRDGFVLVGSVSGQRHWSSEINLESQITCGIWTPDDQQVTPLKYGCVMSKSWNLRKKLVKY